MTDSPKLLWTEITLFRPVLQHQALIDPSLAPHTFHENKIFFGLFPPANPSYRIQGHPVLPLFGAHPTKNMEKAKQRKQKTIRKRPVPERLQGQVYLDPKFDTGFKELFDSEDALKDFLDGVLQLEGDDKIKSLTFSFDKTVTMRSALSKKVILDIFATTGTGRFIDVEMQKAEHDFFIDRAVLYKAFLIIKGKQEMEHSKEFLALSKVERESKRYELPETVSIWICDFNLPDSKEGEYIDEWALYSRNSLKNSSTTPIFEKNKYIMISLPRFKKSIGEIHGSVDAWLYLLNHAGEGKELPNFGNEILEEALERIRVDNADDDLLTRQEKDMVTQEEIETRLAGGMIRAQAEGLAKGLAKGLAEGRAKGLAEGESKGHRDAIAVLQGMNLPPEQISEFKAKLATLNK